MKILVFGSTGMLGHKLIQVLSPAADVWGTVRDSGERVAGLGILSPDRVLANVDASSEGSIRAAIAAANPQVVINAVGIVKQVPSASDTISTLMINSIFPHRLAQMAESFGFRLITISTDCVFDGQKGNYTEADLPDARDLYGKSKELGEVVDGGALTIRTSIIGREIDTAHGLVEWFLSNRGGKVRGFRNAVFSGFPTLILADIIRSLIFEHPGLLGLYHVSSSPINKYELLKLLGEFYDTDAEIEPYDEPQIDRSLDSTRFRQATGFEPRPWREMILTMVSDPTPYDKWR